ncbi:unnamed protein product [Cochlearia groenlandica]
MSERKRDPRDFEASSTSLSPVKKKKLDDSSTAYHVAIPSSSFSSDSAQGGFSVKSTGEDDERSSSTVSVCFNSESNGIAENIPAFVVDLEARKISEIETSTSITRNCREEGDQVLVAFEETTENDSSSAIKRDNRKKPARKTPTPAEIEDFFSELENDEKQKRFIEKYNFDIVNDKPLHGRYKWDLINFNP